MRGWFSDGRLVCRPMNVNKPVMRIHEAAQVETRVQSSQPQDTGGDFGSSPLRIGYMADHLACLEDSADGEVLPDFLGNPMQSQRSTLGILELTCAEARCGAGKQPGPLINALLIGTGGCLLNQK